MKMDLETEGNLQSSFFVEILELRSVLLKDVGFI